MELGKGRGCLHAMLVGGLRHCLIYFYTTIRSNWSKVVVRIVSYRTVMWTVCAEIECGEHGCNSLNSNVVDFFEIVYMKYNLLSFGDRFSPRLQACCFQDNSHYTMTIYTVNRD